MKKLIITALASAFVLGGCGSKDAEYYGEHVEEAKTKLKECVQEDKRDDKECKAAAEGLNRAMMKVINDTLKRQQEQKE